MRWVFILFAALSVTAQAQPILQQIPGPIPGPIPRPSPVVVELFTSQGCSSCPPADAILRELATRPEILALSFHVTYWNSLGWTDPYSLDIATKRQRDYQRLFDTDSIYTPQLVVQGTQEMVGSDRQAIARAIMQEAAKSQAAPGPLVRLLPGPDGLAVQIGAGSGVASVMLIGFDQQHRTAIARGENAGRDVTEANIVRSFRKIGEWDGTRLSLTAPVPIGEQAAILLQAPNWHILGAAVLHNIPPDREQG